MTRRATDITGHACEQYVCYDLARRGLRVVNNPFENSPYDVIAEYQGRLIKIQVKGTAKPSVKINSDKRTSTSYRFNYSQEKNTQCDLIAFVALDKETVFYKLPENITNKSKGFNVATSRMDRGCDKELLALLDNTC